MIWWQDPRLPTQITQSKHKFLKVEGKGKTVVKEIWHEKDSTCLSPFEEGALQRWTARVGV